MSHTIIMPKLSDTMTEGQLGAWRKNVGEQVERGDIIAEVETDKAIMELEAFASGILLEQRVQPGELVPVGTVIGLIGQPGDLSGAAPQPPLAAPAAETVVPATTPTVTATPAVPEAGQSPAAHSTQAAPVVRRRAEELGIDLDTIRGSGPGGRIMLEDLHAPATKPSFSSSQQSATPQAASQVSTPDKLRSAIARTTSAAWHTIPHFYLTCEIDMARAETVVSGLKGDGVAVSLNGLIMTAVAQALQAFPALNSAYGDPDIISYATVNLSFAVALPNGLQMPVIRDAQNKGVRELSDEATRLTERARQGGLTLNEISGGSFSISNLGMYGIDTLASIVMPGQGGILGLGAVADRPAVREGQVIAARTMKVTISCDHRIIDGAAAALFLNEVKRLLEHPAELPA